MRTDERLLAIVSRVRATQCGCIASGGAKTCRELYGVGSWCSECLAHELADMVDLPAPAPQEAEPPPLPYGGIYGDYGAKFMEHADWPRESLAVEVARLQAQLAKAEVHRDAARAFHATVIAERDALRQQKDEATGLLIAARAALAQLQQEQRALREALNGVVQEMRESERAAGQFATDGPDDVFTAMASAEAERLSGWADRIVATLATSQKGA